MNKNNMKSNEFYDNFNNRTYITNKKIIEIEIE